MCRWNAQPLVSDELLYRTQHGLIDQALHARMGVATTNGDGFGIGWYTRRSGTASSTPSR
jgi:predicted glutamine amidotransferase